MGVVYVITNCSEVCIMPTFVLPYLICVSFCSFRLRFHVVQSDLLHAAEKARLHHAHPIANSEPLLEVYTSDGPSKPHSLVHMYSTGDGPGAGREETE